MAHPHLPRFPVPVLVFVFLVVHVHVLASHAGPLPPMYDGSMCSNSSWCGSIEVKYPFYFADESRVTTDNTTTYSCGYTDLMIFCDGKNAMIQLDKYKYTVKHIDYYTSTIVLTVADAYVDAFGVGPPRCRDVLHNVSFVSDWLRYEDRSNDNLTFFLDCYSQSGNESPGGLDVYKIDCPAPRNKLGGGVSLVFSSEQHEVPKDLDLAEHCGQVFVVPVLNDPQRDLSMLPKEYGLALWQGFDLDWYPITRDKCSLCEQSKGRCAYSQNKTFLGCLCADEKVATTYCSSNSGDSIAPSGETSKSFRN